MPIPILSSIRCSPSGRPQATLKQFPTGIVLHSGFGSRDVLATGTMQTYPWLAGFIVQDKWNLLQPTQTGVLDFSHLDTNGVLRAATDRKPAMIQVKTGGGSSSAIPSWISRSPFYRPVHYQTDSVQGNLCPWDDVVLNEWLKTCEKLAARYDRNPWVRGIYVTGVCAQATEMVFPDDTKFTIPDHGSFTLDHPAGLSAVAVDIVVHEEIDHWPTAGGFRIAAEGANSLEDVWYASKVDGTKTFSECTRGVNGTTAGTHADAAIVGVYNPWTTIGLNPIYSDAVYIATWVKAICGMAAMFEHTPLVVLLDLVNNVSGAGTVDTVFGWNGIDSGVLSTIEADATLSKQCHVGTANMGNMAAVDMTQARYSRMRKRPVSPGTETQLGTRRCGIYYEIGNSKLTGVAGDLREALRRGRQDCGAQAVQIANTTWVRDDPATTTKDEIRQASLDFWGI